MSSILKIRFKKIKFLLIGLALILLSSCLKMEISLDIHRNGNVDIALEYVFDQNDNPSPGKESTEEEKESYSDQNRARFGRGFGSDEPWPIPLTEKSFRLQTMRNEGVELLQYKHRVLPSGGDRIRVKLRANSIDAVARYFDWNITTTGDSRSGSLRIVLPAMGEVVLQEETRELLKEVFSNSEFILMISPPKRPHSVEGGSIRRSTAYFHISLQDLALSERETNWSLAW